MENQATLRQYAQAGYSHFLVVTEEMAEAVKWVSDELGAYHKDFNYKDAQIATWGFSADTADPMVPLKDLENGKPFSVVILKNYNWFLKDAQTGQPNYEAVQYIQDNLGVFRSRENRKIIVILSNVSANSALPNELRREFVTIGHGLPTEGEIKDILERTITTASKNPKFKGVSDEDKGRLIEAARGMTRSEITNSFFLSLVKTTSLDHVLVTDSKAQYLEGVAGVKYLKYSESFEDLKGYDRLKAFVRKTAPSPLAKGICLLGPPGTGKSHFAKAMANTMGIQMLTVEMAEWQGSLVGETEEKVRKAIEAIKAMGRCVVFVDELEKGLAGAGGKGAVTSNEVTMRAMGQWLKFMQDRPEGIYFIATCNDVAQVPPEYLRAERWDTAPFFIDLPNDDEQKSILEHYMKVYDVKCSKGSTAPDTEGWSGAEIKSLCRISKMMDVPLDKAADFIVPISVTMKERIDSLREWAEGRTLPASLRMVKWAGSKKGKGKEKVGEERDLQF